MNSMGILDRQNHPDWPDFLNRLGILDKPNISDWPDSFGLSGDSGLISGLCYKPVTVIINDDKDSGLYYKTSLCSIPYDHNLQS